MGAEQRSPGCGSDEWTRGRTLSRETLRVPASDRAAANAESWTTEGCRRMPHLKPDRGKPAVRDFREGEGNISGPGRPGADALSTMRGLRLHGKPN